MVIDTFFAVKRYTSGGRLRMYDQMRGPAQQRNNTLLLSRIELASSHDRYTRELENQWEASTDRKMHVDAVRVLDAVADPLLTSIRDINEAQIQGLAESDPLVAAAARIRQTVYPNGIAAITSLPFVDQAAAMEVIVTKLQSERAADVDALGLTGRVLRLAEVTAAYRQAVNAVPVQISFAPVQEARDRGHRLFLEVLSIILGSYYDGDNAEHVSARAELLAPVTELDRNHRLRARRRRANQAPETGAEVPAEGELPAEESEDTSDLPEKGDGSV